MINPKNSFQSIMVKFGWLFIPYYIYKLKNINFQSIEQMVHSVTESKEPLFRLIRSNQNKEEIVQLLNLVSKLKPKIVVEIGSAAGGTFFMLSKVAADDAHLVSIDIPHPVFHGVGGYPKWKGFLFHAFRRQFQKITLIRDDSHDNKTFLELQQSLNKNSIDVLFIDGDHSYEGVKRDFDMYAPLVKSGGLIAFHDIVPGPERKVGGVPVLWKELRKSHSFHEFVNNWEQQRYGIGVLIKE